VDVRPPTSPRSMGRARSELRSNAQRLLPHPRGHSGAWCLDSADVPRYARRIVKENSHCVREASAELGIAEVDRAEWVVLVAHATRLPMAGEVAGQDGRIGAYRV
jgi:hypothetical protein